MFDGFKRIAGNQTLKKRLEKLVCKRRFHNFTTAKSVGLLYVHNNSVEKEVNEFIQFLTKRGIKVQTLAYSNLSTQLSFANADNRHLLCKAQTNWFGKPQSDEVETFIKTHFDILIDFSRNENYSLRYIATLSQAAMRVGRLAYPKNPYEFIITMPSGSDDKAFIQQLEQYLQTIQTA